MTAVTARADLGPSVRGCLLAAALTFSAGDPVPDWLLTADPACHLRFATNVVVSRDGGGDHWTITNAGPMHPGDALIALDGVGTTCHGVSQGDRHVYLSITPE